MTVLYRTYQALKYLEIKHFLCSLIFSILKQCILVHIKGPISRFQENSGSPKFHRMYNKVCRFRNCQIFLNPPTLDNRGHPTYSFVFKLIILIRHEPNLVFSRFTASHNNAFYISLSCRLI